MEGNLLFLLCLTLYLRAISKYKLFLRVFCITSLGGLYLEGLIHGRAYFTEFYGMFFAIYRKRQQVTISPNYLGSYSFKFFKFHIVL